MDGYIFHIKTGQGFYPCPYISGETPGIFRGKSGLPACRNSLVRANYNDLKNGIYETTEYLEVFLRNLLLNENHPLQNRTLHIRS